MVDDIIASDFKDVDHAGNFAAFSSCLELIDSLPALELPSALAFLEFLQVKGTKALAQANAGRGDSRRADDSPAEIDVDDEDERTEGRRLARRPEIAVADKLSS